ncbi:MAG: hypothetical protein ABL926_06640, partial [Novosphingobium sp.]|uniref:hypothetical protein n=1 Tax=Novosphingobium sp. TaxID=1874826 RepID=UPI0032B74F28
MQIDLSADQAMLSAARRFARRTPWMPLLSALLELAQGRGELLRHSERAWASVTFTGTRHSVALAFTGAEAVAAGELFIDALPDHEFAIPRQLVADAAVVRVDHTALPEPRLEVEVELLLLDEV